MKKIMFWIVVCLSCCFADCGASMYMSFHFHFSTDRSSDDVYSYDARVCYVRDEAFNTFERGVLITPDSHRHLITFEDDYLQIQNSWFTSFDEFSEMFPPGEYVVMLKGDKSMAKFSFTQEEINFPQHPEIYYPGDYQENVSLNPVVTFRDFPDNSITTAAMVWDDEGNEVFNRDLGREDNFVTISGLEPLTWYTVQIRYETTACNGCFSGYEVRFKTGLE